MKVTDISLNFRVSVVVLSLGIFLAGIISYVSLPREAFPEVEMLICKSSHWTIDGT